MLFLNSLRHPFMCDERHVSTDYFKIAREFVDG